jgi:RNA polymerase sigma-70 factor (ECF subfamily)
MHATIEIDTVWKQHRTELQGFISSRIPDPSVTEDLLQDVFLKIHLKKDQLRDSARLQSWLYRITRNVITDFYRKNRSKTELKSVYESWVEEEERDVVKELAGCVVPFVKVLPEPYQEAVMLVDLQGMKQTELAVHQGISLSGAKSRVQRGRRMLKQILESCCRYEFDKRGKIIGYEPR